MKSQASALPASPSRTRRPRPSARTLEVVSLCLWVASLALTGFVVYAEQRRTMGVAILTIGWLSPLMGNFAWFANPLFLWALVRLKRKRQALGLTVLAVLLALDTFRLSSYLLDEGGGSTAVYAYGWGAVLWFAALCVLVMAAGTRQIEARIESGAGEGTDEWFRPIGFFLCFSMLMAAGYLAVQDRRHANSVERVRLSGLAFKRGPVCGANEPTVQQPMIRNSGPVEVRLSEDSYTGIAYPLNKPTGLLEWGIPVVRIAGRDYSYISSGGEQILTSIPASATAAAVLFVAASLVEDRLRISAKLVEQATGRTVFDQVWRAEANGVRYCPDYSISPKESEQPRKLITEALAVQLPPAGVQGKATRTPRTADNRVNAVIFSSTEADLEAEGATKPTETAGPQSSVPGVRRPWRGNQNCPDNVGWDGDGLGGPVRVDTGWPFMVGDRAFYPRTRERYNALCAGDHAYLFFGSARDGKYYLTLEKRRLSDFNQAWSGIVVIQDQHLGNDVLKVYSVNEGADGLTIGLATEHADLTMVVKALAFPVR